MTENVTINTHSSIRIQGEKVMYFDPFEIREENHDADIIFFTHDHFDHFSPEAFVKIAKPETVYVMPETIKGTALKAGIRKEKMICLKPGEETKALGIRVEAVWAYNPAKQFHPKRNNWLGYVVTSGGIRYYIAGDTDITPEAEAVRCDVALVPAGGTYTMTAQDAAALVNKLHPAAAVPTHYGTVAGNPGDGERFMALVDPSIRCELKVGK